VPKVHIDLTVRPEINQWFKENGVKKSGFFEMAWELYVKNNPDYRAKNLAEQITHHTTEADRCTKEFKKITGTINYQKYLDDFNVKIMSEEHQRLQSLYDAMSDGHKAMIGNPNKEHFVINWIGARSSDFGLNLPAPMILERIKNNGGSMAGDSD